MCIRDSFRFEHTSNHIFFSFQIRSYIWILQENLFFALQENKTQIGSAEVATTAKQISFLGGTTLNKLVRSHFSDCCNGNNKSFLGCRSISPDQVNSIL